MMSAPSPFQTAILLAVVFFMSGCGASSDSPPTGTVTGVVTLDGKPLSGVVVSFSPEVGTLGQPSLAATDGEGRYELKYNATTKGAVVGSHKVSVTTPTEGPDPKFKDPIPKKYNSKTELTEKVTAGDNIINLDLLSK